MLDKKYKFQDPDTKEFIDVQCERWSWVAIYKDNTELHQFDPNTGQGNAEGQTTLAVKPVQQSA